MSAAGESPQLAVKPKSRQFRRANAPRPEPQLVARQAEATMIALRALGSIEAARAFLNSGHEELGGRPIDIAGSGPEGLRRVAAAMAAVRAGD